MRRYMQLSVILAILILLAAPLAARPNQGPAIGVQAGFLATGVVVDIPLGGISLNAGVNYPLGFKYIEWAAGETDGDFFIPYFTVTGDITVPFALGENFDLKVGLSTLAFTDFETGMFGVAGGAVKGEYWIPNKDMGLFVNLNVPIAVYILTEDQQWGMVNAFIPLVGLFTTTAGVLWTF
ncbi:MAG: hypothetical protein CVV48_15985 [Spirochaetae bacterium HGW-Spirochaetae-4]|nr:MAG: hypothetical protein CVV48_15985 [Spirochaetae bacterium HGW-Spirochaetae-4]HCS37011.1 hypothetical protein [Sphaerochaeta sp.]